MLPYYHGGFVPNNNQQQQQQQEQQQQQQQSDTQQSQRLYDAYGQSMLTEQRQIGKEISHVNFSPMPASSQGTIAPHLHQQQQHSNYPEYVLMHDQPYPDFTYDPSTLINTTSLTPLPETEYVRQQEDVFSELISLANRRQHHQNPSPLPPAPPHLASSSYSYPTHLSHQGFPATAATITHTMTAGPSLLTSSSSAPLAAAAVASSSSSRTGILWDAASQERIYELKVVQQPFRARMCGFGDKDRRPISPPPILQLVTRTRDGRLIKPEFIDISFFIVLCDSWHEDGVTEANLVYHSFSSPPPAAVTQPQQQQHSSSSASSLTTTSHHQQYHSIAEHSPPSNDEITRTLQMRNLVGSSVASAAKLYDLDGNLGIFFVFQDISFRTEGKFKLAFSLINVGSTCGNTVNTSSPTQVLTRVFTDMFTVFTAKKFPGVVKSTPLSQCFAKQGVKIPIRKDTQVKRKKSTAKQGSSSSFADTLGDTLLDDDVEDDDANKQ